MRSRVLSAMMIACVLLGLCIWPGLGRTADVDSSEIAFWVPAIPPRAHYTIDCRVDPSASTLRGTETIAFRNSTSKPIRRLALDWTLNDDQTVEIKIREKLAPILEGSEKTPLASPILFELPEPLLLGKQVELHLSFSKPLTALGDQNKVTLTEWHPRLWWGFPTHDDYDVRIQAPAEYAVGTSGGLDPKSGYYHADNVRSFGLFLGRAYKVMESNAGGVLVRSLFTPRAEPCAQLLVKTAVDVINFYRQRFGFYPYASLTIVPGMDRPEGGYPVATAIVAIHGQEQMSERLENYRQWATWITAHEIGHQYWGEYVLEKDDPGWLWIGLGIYADREYVRARQLGPEMHQRLFARYTGGVRQHLDTTVARPPEQVGDVGFNFNSVVIHGKGFSIVSALGNLLGPETFDRIYRRCLKEFAARRLGAHEFQVLCEAETGQDLGWFFDQWVHSNRYLSYHIASQKCAKQDGRYFSEVDVRSVGTLKMPIPVVAYFHDGTNQRKFTDRLLDVNLVLFESTTPLKEVRLDPDGELALVVPPPPITEKDLGKRIQRMPWTGAGKQALDLFNAAKEAKLADADLWRKLGLTLYDGKYYTEALEAFRRATELAEKGSYWGFASIVWQGHLLDLLGRREEALQRYREALEKDTGLTMRHDQYGMVINREWIEERIRTPFQRR